MDRHNEVSSKFSHFFVRFQRNVNFLQRFSKNSQTFLDTLFIADGEREREREREREHAS